MTYLISRHVDAGALLARAESWLLRAEAEHNVILAVAYRSRGRTDWEDGPPFFATVERGGEMVGCVFRTPPFKLVLTELPEECLPAVVDAVGEVYEEVPAVFGTEPVARRFAELWSRARPTAARVGMRQRLYQLDAVLAPARVPAGVPRWAVESDVELVADWHSAFVREVGLASRKARKWAEERISGGVVLLWDDGGARSLAVRVGDTPNAARIGGVYTPPEWRGRGYASACVAALSQSVLDGGKRFCFLYTDLSNPTSNSIYQQIGYRPLRDYVDVDFQLGGAGAG